MLPALSVADQHASLQEVSAAAIGDLAAIISAMPTDPVGARDFLMDHLPSLVDQYAGMAGVIAADWYDALREMVDASHPFAAEIAAMPGGMARIEASVRWGVDPLFHPEAHGASPLDLLSGSVQRMVGDSHRATIADASAADPAAVGWSRYGLGSCAWCRMLISRGAVYRSGQRFASHDHCRCVAGPAFINARAVQAYVPSSRTIAQRAASNAAGKAWIATNLQTTP